MSLDDEKYRAAIKRCVEAKWKMDAAQAALDKAEDEWFMASRALDEIEAGVSPS